MASSIHEVVHREDDAGILHELDPADAFDALTGARPSAIDYARHLEVLAGPGEIAPVSLRAGDFVLSRALGEGRLAHLMVLESGVLEDGAPDGRSGRFAWTEDGRQVLVTGRAGRLPRDRMLVRLRGGRARDESWLERCADDVDDGAAMEATHSCLPGEGPPAPEPDPTGRGPHPLINKGSTRARSRRPSVGHAQQKLNEYLAQTLAGTFTCRDNRASTQRFIQERLSELRAASQLPLTVDCRFGTNTRRATRAFQACMGLQRDGKIGPLTWPLLDAVHPAAAFRIRVDADRDGSVDATDAPSTWTWGASGSGAVILVNNDDDGVNGSADNTDDKIDTGGDASEIAHLVIERVGSTAPPAGTTVDLIVDRHDAIRIFGGIAAGDAEIVGPSTSASHRFTTLPSPVVTLGMEGVRYAGTGFDGEITIKVRISPPTGSPVEVTTVVRVAPWMMSSHLAKAEKVFVWKGPLNASFRAALSPLVTAAGCTLVSHQPSSGHADVWMQDCMEFGSANLPTRGFRTVIRAPRAMATSPANDLRSFPPTLLADDLGFTRMGSAANPNSLDSSGNLEVSPPVKVGPKDYPHGRIYFCGRRTTVGSNPTPPPILIPAVDQLNADLESFLRRQVVQAPFSIDTGWLMVSHVDEVVSFVPTTGGKGFKMLIASTALAYQLLDALVLTNPTDKVLTGRTFPVDHGTPSPFPAEMTIRDFLALDDDFHPDLQNLIALIPGIHTTQTLRAYNNDRQVDLDGIKTTMKRELGLVDADIIEVPSVFMPNPTLPQHADALFAGMVNMLVINKHCIVPDPFGPIVGANDAFQQDLSGKLTPLGLTVGFIDCWDTYHVALGEVHCGTNTLRELVLRKWWEFQP